MIVEHPAAKKVTAEAAGNGRVLSRELRARILTERGNFPQPRSALLAALHMAQEEQGYLSRGVIDEIAELLEILPIQVQEVVSFYPMFHDRPVGKSHIQVCTNIACALRGARKLVRHAENKLGLIPGEVSADGKFSIGEVECLGSCGSGPVIQVNNQPFIEQATTEDIDALLADKEVKREAQLTLIPDGVEGYLLPPNGVSRCNIDDYVATGGYEMARKAWTEMEPEAIAEVVKNAGLRGRGGAGFATGVKWGFMPKDAPKPSYLAVNGDESEPGTFKDRQILERNPHQFLEGVAIGVRAIRGVAAYIYLRGEYTTPYRILMEAIHQAYSKGFLGDNAFGSGKPCHIYVQRGAGAYICGEETGMIESMEGKKGQPRKRPPFPAGYGLWGCPTTVNNLETLTHVPVILRKGADWFKARGTEKSTGNTLFGISGHVKRPGVYELPLGTPMREIIEKHAGGVLNGRPIKAIIPGGVSMPVLTADKIDVNMDHDSLQKAGTLLGTGGIVVMDDSTCPVRAAIVIARFFRHETCGQCTQCREGTAFFYKLLKRIERGDGALEDLDTIQSVTTFMEGATICALSDAAAWAAGNFMRRFRPDFERHIHEKGCPFPESFEP
ncbi:MAG TPA: NADH-quinone oxidoreductase subunit NuoF [Candidatus Acidoferrales bacterium]|nr:NADH-quinone oxidoreductase subunit NuoF [Candidatus Acidoferrales bacterium]